MYVEGEYGSQDCSTVPLYHELDEDNNRNTIAARISTDQWTYTGHQKLNSHHVLIQGGVKIETKLKVDICPIGLTIQ